ncbi:hypothetical protein [Dyadobacter sp. OTU695]|uniref:hypothetical protein n=1 Tax=Dyadobacter sp. OTU695 TaxID=3043860 RepID=UPI00313D6CB9
MKTILIKHTVFLLLGLANAISSCDVNDLKPIANSATLPMRLSDYNIFQNGGAGLPTARFHTYRLATPLFTDYAEKQRLLYLPQGTHLSFDQAGNPVFPDSSMLVKTFFYYSDKRDTKAGKRLIETRILIKIDGQWNVGTYEWDEAQTDAFLLEGGTDKPVNWVNEMGVRKTILYHIPSSAECSGCHRSDQSVTPIGPKARNLNIPLEGHSDPENQLSYFQKTGIVKLAPADQLITLPDWQNPSHTLAQRARAYLDVNCAHCHSTKGLAQSTRLLLDYALPFADTRIHARRNDILYRIQSTNKNIRMPKLGITVPDSAGIALIKAYIQSL